MRNMSSDIQFRIEKVIFILKSFRNLNSQFYTVINVTNDLDSVEKIGSPILCLPRPLTGCK